MNLALPGQLPTCKCFNLCYLPFLPLIDFFFLIPKNSESEKCGGKRKLRNPQIPAFSFCRKWAVLRDLSDSRIGAELWAARPPHGAWAQAENPRPWSQSAAPFCLRPVEPGGLEFRLTLELIFKSSLQVDNFFLLFIVTILYLMMKVYFSRIRCSSTDEKVFSRSKVIMWGLQACECVLSLCSSKPCWKVKGSVSHKCLIKCWAELVHTSSSWVTSLPAFPPSGPPLLSQSCRLFREQRKMNQSLVSFAVYLFTPYSVRRLPSWLRL